MSQKPTSIHLSASLIAADFTQLGNEIERALDAGFNSIHFDVMDHHYVPNLSIGPMVLQSITQRFPSLICDVHLMVSNPYPFFDAFAEAGATQIAFHPETVSSPIDALQSIRSLGMKAGLVFNPDQPPSISSDEWDSLDHILLMSVFPGFGGQAFIPEVIETIHQVRAEIDTHQKPITLAVDGGISPHTIQACVDAGADFFVVGSALFGSHDYRDTTKHLREYNLK